MGMGTCHGLGCKNLKGQLGFECYSEIGSRGRTRWRRKGGQREEARRRVCRRACGLWGLLGLRMRCLPVSQHQLNVLDRKDEECEEKGV